MVHLAFNVAKWDPTEETLARLLSKLTRADQEKFTKFYFKVDKLRFLSGQIISRCILLDLLRHDVKVDDLVLARTDIGKPYLALPSLTPQPQFNISHHGDWVIGSGCHLEGRLIGVDVSKVETGPKSGLNFTDAEVKEFLAAFKDNFSEPEWNYMYFCANSGGSQSGPLTSSSIKMHAFSRLWCLKESYIKGLGVGLMLDLRRLEFVMDDKRFWTGREGKTGFALGAITHCSVLE
ncbi:hypothetical protein HDU67_005706 [Dinochytrium kinnereticum]|nr:hypothetical protein HDU67_005706 [Dinochytrium kinnereticum]